MSDEEITLPPLPHRALRPGAGDDAMREFARAAILLDRQQRAAPRAEPVLDKIEQYRMQMAGICTAALGYWKEGEAIHPDYDTPALREVARLYAKYRELHDTTRPDHTALLRQALEALIKARDTTYSDTLYPQFEVAIDALRAALGEKR